MSDLESKHCVPCEGGVAALNKEQVSKFLKHIPEWQAAADNKEISREFTFKNYYHTLAFVNAIAWIAHQENHHPDLEVSYNKCRVRYSTHAIGGLSDNDFICAAKVNAVFNAKK